MKIGAKEVAKNLVLISIVMLFSILVYSHINVPVLSMIFITLLVVYLGKSNANMLENKKIKIAFIFILVCKFILALYSAVYKNIPMTGVDWEYYNLVGKRLVEQGASFIEIFASPSDMFANFTGLVYKIFGISPNQMFLYNFVMSLITFKFIYKTVNVLTESANKAMVGAMIFWIWPIEIIFSVSFLREMPMQALLSVSIYNFVKFVKEKKYKNIAGAILSSMFATMMHSGVIGILLIYVLYLAFYKGEGLIKILSFKRIMTFIVVMSILFLTPIADKLFVRMSSLNMRKRIITKIELKIDSAIETINEKLKSKELEKEKQYVVEEPVVTNEKIDKSVVTTKEEKNEEKINNKTSTSIEQPKKTTPKVEIKDIEKSEAEVLSENFMKSTKSGYKYGQANTTYIESNPETMGAALLQVPYRWVNYTFSPFIWQVFDVQTFLSFLFDGLLQLFIWFSMIKWVFFDKNRTRKMMLIKITFLLMIIGTNFIFSWGTYTYGTAIRHRTKILPIMLCILPIIYDWEKLLKKIKVVN